MTKPFDPSRPSADDPPTEPDALAEPDLRPGRRSPTPLPQAAIDAVPTVARARARTLRRPVFNVALAVGVLVRDCRVASRSGAAGPVTAPPAGHRQRRPGSGGSSPGNGPRATRPTGRKRHGPASAARLAGAGRRDRSRAPSTPIGHHAHDQDVHRQHGHRSASIRLDHVPSAGRCDGVGRTAALTAVGERLRPGANSARCNGGANAEPRHGRQREWTPRQLATPPATSPSSPRPRGPNRPMHLLLVEDDERLARSLTRLLEEDRHVVEHAPDGRTGHRARVGARRPRRGHPRHRAARHVRARRRAAASARTASTSAS